MVNERGFVYSFLQTPPEDPFEMPIPPFQTTNSAASRHGDPLRALSSARSILYKICLRCAHGDAVEADDLLAEATLRVMEAAQPAQDQIGNPISWWATIIRNIARDRHRQRVCRRELPEFLCGGDAAADPTHLALDGLSYILARRELRTAFEAMARLPKRQRQALLLRATGSEYDEIAREVGTTYANTRKLVQVARRQLRQLFEQSAVAGDSCADPSNSLPCPRVPGLPPAAAQMAQSASTTMDAPPLRNSWTLRRATMSAAS